MSIAEVERSVVIAFVRALLQPKSMRARDQPEAVRNTNGQLDARVIGRISDETTVNKIKKSAEKWADGAAYLLIC